MSDLTIPGVTSQYNTDKMIEGLMKLERVPLERMQTELETYESQKSAWRDLNSHIGRFQSEAKKLYGFENPFRERTVSSSNEDIITATATREAEEQEIRLQVLRKAAADRFLSASLDDDYRVPGGRYEFTVGDEKIGFDFREGSLEKFVKSVNKRGDGLLQARLIRDRIDSRVLLIESTATGAENRLDFHDAARELALTTGILTRSRSDSLTLLPGSPETRPWPPSSALTGVVEQGGTVTLQPGGRGRIDLGNLPASRDDLIMEIGYSIKEYTDEEAEAEKTGPPPGPSMPNPGGVEFGGVAIRNSGFSIDLPRWEPPEEPPRVDDMNILFALTPAGQTSLGELRSGSGEQTMTLPLEDLPRRLTALGFDNKNTHREVTITSLRIYNPEERGEYIPANPVSTAGNALLDLDGIEISRPGNTIDDLVPGITFQVENSSDERIRLSVEPDRELVKEQLIAFVGNYNRLQAELHILTGSDEVLIEELEYFSREEKESAREKLGLYQGDSSLLQLKSRLQRTIMNPYPTDAGRELSLLAQSGISTNSGGFGGGLDATKLRGYLEINEDQLDQILQTEFDAVKQLFGQDTDGDLMVDTGVAYATEQVVKAYTGAGGVISYRLSSLDSRIEDKSDEIDTYQDKLEDIEADLKRKYGAMEGAINSMQESSGMFDSLNNNGN